MLDCSSLTAEIVMLYRDSRDGRLLNLLFPALSLLLSILYRHDSNMETARIEGWACMKGAFIITQTKTRPSLKYIRQATGFRLQVVPDSKKTLCG